MESGFTLSCGELVRAGARAPGRVQQAWDEPPARGGARQRQLASRRVCGDELFRRMFRYDVTGYQTHGSANAGSYWVRVIASVNTHTTRVTTHNFAILAPSHPIPQCTVGLSALLSTVEVYDPASRSDQVRTAGRKG